MISCLIYCLLKEGHKSNIIYEVELALKELNLILGEGKEKVLSQKFCASYCSDLEFCIDYIKKECTVQVDRGQDVRPD